jgi:tetratricopeptide (TPR) repeat protein
MRLFSVSIVLFGLLSALLSLPGTALANPQYVQWGNQMLQQKKYDDAIKYFTGAAKADPKDAAAYKGLGYAFMYKGDKTKALEYLTYSLELNPDDNALKAYVDQVSGKVAAPAAGSAAQSIQYGNYYLQQKNYDAAVGWYNKATQAEPENARAWQVLGNAYYDKGDKPNAIGAWERSVSLDPSNAQLTAYLTQVKGSATASAGQAAGAQAEAPEEIGPAANPWVMGLTVAVLGSVMLFLF